MLMNIILSQATCKELCSSKFPNLHKVLLVLLLAGCLLGFRAGIPQGVCCLCPLGIGEVPSGTAGRRCPRALAKVANVERRSWPVVDFGDSIIPWFKMDSVRVR